MPNVKIDGFQLFSIIVLFLFGTTIFLNIGSGAREDAWIVTLISPVAGMILFTIYYRLYKYYPDLPLTEYIKKIMGKYVGSIISYFYIIYFIYIASRVLRDMEELLSSSPYTRTSLITLGISMLFVLIYAINLGFEVISRVILISFFIIGMALFIMNILFVINGYIIHLENIKPILAEGWKPIFKELPLSTMVPYGELITLSMILPFINKHTKILKVGIMAIGVAGLYLTLNILILISILGTETLSSATSPALTAVGYINIAGFIQRLDTFIIILVVILGFVKVSLFFFCAVIGMNNLFKIKQNTLSTFSIGAVIFLSSILIAPSYQTHIDEGLKTVPYVLHLPFQIVIPILLFILVTIKEKVTRNTSLN
ncbi:MULTISPECIES: GerAB/ArcD/ProY family transporter [unclassified Fredinandcohnia]|mgnify:CR=1 FL=1|uniref:GerAB/ArcD/ProY family transporter n=1 Tax=unclassified Fredinandcohnia TaxID=2837514 RepID=UPI0030FD7715